MAKNKSKVDKNVVKEEILTEPVSENLNETDVVTEEPVKEVTKEKSTKAVNKNYTSDSISWTTDKIILRVGAEAADTIQESEPSKSYADTDYVRTFAIPITVNKDKIGKRTKFRNNEWCVITDIIEDKDLIFIVKLEK